jgi:VanZ family protein
MTIESRPGILPLARIVAWSLATAIVTLSMIPADLRPDTGVPHYLEHFLIYAAAGMAFGLGYDLKSGLTAILLLIFTGAVEIAQLFVPGRHARLSDFIVDAFAVCTGLMLSSLTRRIGARFDLKLDP